MTIRSSIATLGRLTVTLAIVAGAAVAAQKLWIRYQVEPWTRDGRVRADVAQVAPDVAGLVTRVAVVNDQPVHRGDVLFVIDRDRYVLALRQAEAAVAAQRATLDEMRRELARNTTVGDLVSQELVDQSQQRADTATASLQQAIAARDLAALNLERTVVRAPVDGFLADLNLRTGDYVSPGRPVLGLIDASSYRVEGYFEETKLSRLRVGLPVEVKIMGQTHAVRGHIQSIASGIDDRERQPAASMLPNVNPTFSWVRLAQRVPVRVSLDQPPADLRLITGRTATVSVIETAQPKTRAS
jgi:RND family efflux transporter MFP subunit